jgi:hypothetical protein
VGLPMLQVEVTQIWEDATAAEAAHAAVELVVETSAQEATMAHESVVTLVRDVEDRAVLVEREPQESVSKVKAKSVVEASQQEQAELLAFLNKNSDVFTWSTSNLVGVNRDVIDHRLHVSSTARPKKQKLCKMSEEKVEAVKAMVQRLLVVTSRF